MKRSLRDGSGYLEIDHSDSPGIQEHEIPSRLRDSTPVIPKGEIGKFDIQFCTHCSSQVVLNPKRTRPRSYCAKCDHYICDNPICNKECNPVARLFDREEKKNLISSDEPLIKLTDL